MKNVHPNLIFTVIFTVAEIEILRPNLNHTGQLSESQILHKTSKMEGVKSASVLGWRFSSNYTFNLFHIF